MDDLKEKLIELHKNYVSMSRYINGISIDTIHISEAADFKSICNIDFVSVKANDPYLQLTYKDEESGIDFIFLI